MLPSEFGLEDGLVIGRIRKREGHHLVDPHQGAPHGKDRTAAQTRDPTRRERVVSDFFGEFVGDLDRTKRDVQEPALKLAQRCPLVFDLGLFRHQRKGNCEKSEKDDEGDKFSLHDGSNLSLE